ncbi:MAG: 16S rRNA (uracil(1498)-N(3))-methyltransferase [Thermodesulfovibrionales bacterium]
MPRVYVHSIPREGESARLDGEEARYLASVLRLAEGDEVALFDSAGGRGKASISEIGKRSVVLRVTEALAPEPEPPGGIVLIQGILKGQKMDLVVQKATELGVRRIVPVVTERSQVRETRKGQRWRKVALEAARQSGRAAVPEVRDPVALEEFLGASSPLRGLIFWEEGGLPLREAFEGARGEGVVHAAIGPEGGFSRGEVELARERGLVVATLGSRILRAETAAIAAVALVGFLLEG